MLIAGIRGRNIRFFRQCNKILAAYPGLWPSVSELAQVRCYKGKLQEKRVGGSVWLGKGVLSEKYPCSRALNE